MASSKTHVWLPMCSGTGSGLLCSLPGPEAPIGPPYRGCHFPSQLPAAQDCAGLSGPELEGWEPGPRRQGCPYWGWPSTLGEHSWPRFSFCLSSTESCSPRISCDPVTCTVVTGLTVTAHPGLSSCFLQLSCPSPHLTDLQIEAQQCTLPCRGASAVHTRGPGFPRLLQFPVRQQMTAHGSGSCAWGTHAHSHTHTSAWDASADFPAPTFIGPALAARGI